MRRKRRISAMALLLALTLAASGCAPLPAGQSPSGPVALPTPDEPPLTMAVGDGSEGGVYEAILYYISGVQEQLLGERRNIALSGEDVPAERVMEELLKPPSIPARAIAPEGTKLLSVEQSGDVAVVDLSIDARNVENEQQLVWTRAAIANTLTRLPGVKYVDVLIGGQSESALNLPTGALPGGDGNLTALWALIQSDADRLDKAGAESPWQLERLVTLYYASKTGDFLIPEVRSVRFTSEDYASAIIEELLKPPADPKALRSPFPARGDMLAAPPEPVTSEDGKRLLKLTFDPNLLAILEGEGLKPWQLYASLSYTLTGFLPELDGIEVYIGSGMLMRANVQGKDVPFPSGAIARTTFPGAVGRLATAYFAAQGGQLTSVHRALSQLGARSPRALLSILIGGPLGYETGAMRVAPEGVTEADILGIQLRGNEAWVDLSANFYANCQSFTEAQERSLVYAIVDTLTELPGVRWVRFFLEGEQLDTLVQSISLRGPLMRNPGIIAP